MKTGKAAKCLLGWAAVILLAAGCKAGGKETGADRTGFQDASGVQEMRDEGPGGRRDQDGGSDAELWEGGEWQDYGLTGEPVSIGVIYALSGNNAAIGTNILRGIDFAAEDINRAGGIGGRPVEIVRGDTRGDNQAARQVAERLIEEEQVHAVLGCHQSTLTEVVSQVCEENRIPMITAISTVDSITTHGYEYFFRMCPMNSLYLEKMFMYMRDQEEKTGKKVETIAVLRTTA